PKAKRFGLGIHPFLDSRFHGNDTFFVIPHLMRDPFGLDSRLRGNDKKNAGMTARNDILRKS
ncbi:hypothetical protein CO101_02430, partial [Candidatus Berkelbacteria bacterium CG_4_9_14_3_um_filter_39_23]